MILEEGKKLLNIKCVFWFYLQLLSEKIHILRRTEWDKIKNVYNSSLKSTRYSCQILRNPESRNLFKKKNSSIKFHENPLSGNRVVPCKRATRHDEANSRNFANAPKTCLSFSVSYSQDWLPTKNLPQSYTVFTRVRQHPCFFFFK